MANDPIEQFHIKRLIELTAPGSGLDLSFTNSSLFMLLAAGGAAAFLTFSMGRRALVPGRMQSVAEIFYEFIAGMVRSTMGAEGQRFFPLVFSLFIFILFGNMLGMFPYFPAPGGHSFTFTSHLIVTAALAMLVISIVIVYGFYRNGLKFLKLFVPSGVPAVLIPLITLIEIFSFISRPISLSLRLFANILAGHITLKVFAGFVVMMGSAGALGALGALAPLALTVALTALEFLVAFLQAYVFAILTCIYLNDAVHPGH
ncbi:MAG: F0F1 ATP synthase subunit A [Parvularculaceae bacterium]